MKKIQSSTYVTNTILIILFLIFIAETLLGGSTNINTLIKMGGENNLLVAEKGQWWRLFTAQFLHIGWLHLASNAVMIYYLGQYMEPMLGHLRFLIVYLLSGVGGNLLSFGLGNDATVSAGASTALFGLFGALIAIYLANRKIGSVAELGKQAIALAVINIGLDLFAPGIDVLGHIGGLFAGFFLEIIFGTHVPALRNYHNKLKVISGVVLIIFVIFCISHGMGITN